MVLAFIQAAADPSAWGALLTGLSAFVAACLSLRNVKKHAKTECDERISDIREAFKSGMRVEYRPGEPRIVQTRPPRKEVEG